MAQITAHEGAELVGRSVYPRHVRGRFSTSRFKIVYLHWLTDFLESVDEIRCYTVGQIVGTVDTAIRWPLDHGKNPFPDANETYLRYLAARGREGSNQALPPEKVAELKAELTAALEDLSEDAKYIRISAVASFLGLDAGHDKDRSFYGKNPLGRILGSGVKVCIYEKADVEEAAERYEEERREREEAEAQQQQRGYPVFPEDVGF